MQRISGPRIRFLDLLSQLLEAFNTRAHRRVPQRDRRSPSGPPPSASASGSTCVRPSSR
jgi:hypothetical protein